MLLLPNLCRMPPAHARHAFWEQTSLPSLKEDCSFESRCRCPLTHASSSRRVRSSRPVFSRCAVAIGPSISLRLSCSPKKGPKLQCWRGRGREVSRQGRKWGPGSVLAHASGRSSVGSRGVVEPAALPSNPAKAALVPAQAWQPQQQTAPSTSTGFQANEPQPVVQLIVTGSASVAQWALGQAGRQTLLRHPASVEGRTGQSACRASADLPARFNLACMATLCSRQAAPSFTGPLSAHHGTMRPRASIGATALPHRSVKPVPSRNPIGTPAQPQPTAEPAAPCAPPAPPPLASAGPPATPPPAGHSPVRPFYLRLITPLAVRCGGAKEARM